MKQLLSRRPLVAALLLGFVVLVGRAASAEGAEAAPGAGSAAPPSALDAGAASADVEPAATEQASDSFYSAGGDPAVASFGSEEQGPKLDLYGFIDFTYSQNLSRGDSPFDTFPHFGSFAVGNINLYAAGELGGGFRSLLELRFLYLPHGATTPATGQVSPRVDTSVADYADLERPLRWGGIEVERVFLEYQVSEWLAFQAGQFLTPYGIWNIDHGTPTLVGVRRPYIIGDALFPERQTGLEAHGAFHLDRTSIGYHATLSNGRGPLDSFLDLDANKALGGRLFVRHASVGTLTLGGSAYYGKYTDRSTIYGTAAGTNPPLLEIRDPITEEFTELALAADLRWEWEGLLVQGEVIRSDRGYADEHRRVLVEGRELQPDYSRLGTYGLVGFRTPFFGAMPYVFGETYDFEGNTFLSKAAGTAVGLNVRPQANVVFKAQYFFALLGDESDKRLFRGALRRLDLQVAWAF